MNAPRTGLKKKASSEASASSTPPAKVTASAKKRGADASEVADAFARGNVTLGQALGLTQAQKDVLKARAFALLNEQRFELVTPLLEGLVALDPFDGWTLMALAGLKLDTGDAELARTLLDRALEVLPLDATARALRAEARARTGDAPGAREDLGALKALKGADPHSPAMRRAKALELTLDGAVLPESSAPAIRPVTRSRAGASLTNTKSSPGPRSGLKR